MLVGRALHAMGEAGSGNPTGELRRNTHRLEKKGLCAAHRREAFAFDYIDQLVADVETLAGRSTRNASGS